MRIRAVILCALASLLLAPAQGQQVADRAVDTAVRNPMFQPDAGPLIAIDSGHHNFHTAQGRYQPFADLLRHDGFKLADQPGEFTASSQGEARLLVIANALSAPSAANWNAP